ncbi:MAG: exodeoxyribonuclease VII large subunit [Desulfobacterales bacterium]|nr:exodeoxyribonuclease VII large subunit [Desulfobacterales bacterium]
MISAEKNNGHIYTVASLTREIKFLLEDRYPFLWITGEISNFATPASGHSYFSLKDANAVISCVMFKGQKRRLAFTPENGMKVTGMARISLYEPRGSYQLIFEHMEPEGAGSLQQAFEILKKKLSDKGWFDAEHKKPLPFLPSKISVITSGTGAAVRDIIHVATRRFPGCALEVVPVKVQGDAAEHEIAGALHLVNERRTSDVIILARGGGSIEDLWAFNTETVARAVFESDIPVITGVGHEIDFTIADFVSDLRAPTPSAAAEMALPDQAELTRQVTRLKAALDQAMNKRLDFLEQRLQDLSARLKSPARVVDDFRFRIEDLEERLHTSMNIRLARNRERLFWLRRTLDNTLPLTRIQEQASHVQGLKSALDQAMARQMEGFRSRLRELSAHLEPLNPTAILDRGYSITRELETGRVVMDAQTLARDDRVEIILSKGRLVTRVE